MRQYLLTVIFVVGLSVGLVAQTPTSLIMTNAITSSLVADYSSAVDKFHSLLWTAAGDRLVFDLEAPVLDGQPYWDTLPTRITIGSAVANVTPLCVQSVWDETTHCTDVGTVRHMLFTQTPTPAIAGRRRRMGAAAPVKLTAAQITATLIAQMESLCRQNGVSQIDVLPLIRPTTPLAVK